MSEGGRRRGRRGRRKRRDGGREGMGEGGEEGGREWWMEEVEGMGRKEKREKRGDG